MTVEVDPWFTAGSLPPVISREALGRTWFGLNAMVVVVALALQIPATVASTGTRFDSAPERVANLFAFFTIQSNVLVAATSLVLALAPAHSSTLFRTLRLDAVIGIAVTGLVYHAVLADLFHLTGAEAVADQLFHTVSPLMCVVGWVLFGPRDLVDRRVIAWSLVFPLAWLAFTLVRGAAIDWYPYPFTDVTMLGYGAVALNCLIVAVLFVALATAAMMLDRALGRRALRAVAVHP